MTESHIFVRTLSIRIAFRNNRFAATMRDILSGNEQEGEAQKGVGARRESRQINFVVP